jgi:hypothetical protein
MPFCKTPCLADKAAAVVAPGNVIKAAKDGNWLKENETGYYLPMADTNGNRYFKNERLVLMERATAGGGDDAISRSLSRTSSKGSNDATAPRRTTSGGTIDNLKRILSSSSSSQLSAALSRISFRWVDDFGVSHRIAGDSDLLVDVNVRPEVWVCVKPGGVPYRVAPLLDAEAGKDIACGAKVTAIREDDWLKVMEVKNSSDIMATMEALGRRSMRATTKVELVETGLYLPYTQGGERLFKNEKLVLFEEAQNPEALKAAAAKKDDGCSLM